jgi:hypothetical protein
VPALELNAEAHFAARILTAYIPSAPLYTTGRWGSTNAGDDGACLLRQRKLLTPALKRLVTQHEKLLLSIQVDTMFSVHTRTDEKSYSFGTFGQSMPWSAFSDKLCFIWKSVITCEEG